MRLRELVEFVIVVLLLLAACALAITRATASSSESEPGRDPRRDSLSLPVQAPSQVVIPMVAREGWPTVVPPTPTPEGSCNDDASVSLANNEMGAAASTPCSRPSGSHAG